jgi:HNH endonuclease
MAKKQRGQSRKFWSLYYHLKTIRHPILRKKPVPSHSEMLAVAKDLFGIDTQGMSKWAAIEMISPLIPETGARAAAKRARAKGKQERKKASPRPSGQPLPEESVKFIASDAFLDSYDWKRLRYEVLKNHDGLCEVCGRGRPHGQVLNVDHIKPRRKHPELALDIKNLQVLCGDCNHGKGNWDSTDWRNRAPAITPEERAMDRAAWERFDKF